MMGDHQQYDCERIVQETRFYLSQSAEAMLEVGKRLVILKKHEGHGEFTLSPEPVYYGDLQHINKSNGEIEIIGDGACPPALAGTLGAAKFAEHGIPTEGEAGGISVDLVCKSGDGVLARLGRVAGRFELVIARCSIAEPPEEQLLARRLESAFHSGRMPL